MKPNSSRIHIPESPRLTRRNLLKAAGGVVAAGALGSIALPARALGTDPRPRPIPSGITPFGTGGGTYHFFEAGGSAEPSTIFDFNGVVGVAVIEGTAKEKFYASGITVNRRFRADMRFMRNDYVALDGIVRVGTFGFIRIKVVEDPYTQVEIHHFNLGIEEDTGLVWTNSFEPADIYSELRDRKAFMYGQGMPVNDHKTESQALQSGPSKPAALSFEVMWFGGSGGTTVNSSAQQFRGDYIFTDAKMRWQAKLANSVVFTDPKWQSSPVTAFFGGEANGLYY